MKVLKGMVAEFIITRDNDSDKFAVPSAPSGERIKTVISSTGIAVQCGRISWSMVATVLIDD